MMAFSIDMQLRGNVRGFKLKKPAGCILNMNWIVLCLQNKGGRCV